MLKIAVIYSLNIASILAVITTLQETPETYVEWNIENFFNLPIEIDYYLDSLPFSLANNKWILRIYPNGQTKLSYSGYIGGYLLKRDNGGEYRIDLKLGSKRSDGSVFKSRHHESIFNMSNVAYGWPKLIKRSTLQLSKDSVVPGGTFTVFCKARIVNSIEIREQIASSSGTGTLSDDLKKLYISKNFTDVKLLVKHREFPAHKNLLACRSTVFASMLEKNSEKIEITDSDPDLFEEFLLFLYTGKFANESSKKAMNLYEIADKYKIKELKNECAHAIAKYNLSIDSFCDIFRFAKLHNHSELLKASTDFFITNAKLILSTKKWEKFLVNDPLQGIENLSDHLKGLYTSKHLTDVKLIVKGREFPAHKNILACRSSVFESMLGDVTDEVEITDCDTDSFEEFLLFLYTGKLVDVSSKKAMNLYKTAHKYNMQELMKECAQSVAKHNLSIDSFYDVLRFAELHNDSVLLEALTNFFKYNGRRIVRTEKFLKFREDESLLANKIMHRAFAKQCVVNAKS